ncbi:hypothetical protein PtrSN002B_008644 [Pyrenophora tritici-repentis]|uniref:Uncharacterized protein n=2 Tax=Pyrenophora tritici-repentis TaxID=45151 RepID=A0A2W1DM63_9PLEO|nr:uncharacterized protein PTRG_11854 [Pyrenophora tritici-repentis Pt-1C-BFP]KAA8615346.1 hypothetical protein PtrV1_10742 [Pyrenophora tritici-repentis]EDU46010.1 conserved hypothetical protein [Pyrenophora tritici-repentis Pt-1C-BFP]KAI0574094.1 hypothetical protein Alg215_08789 [Pyrenophora tritici-repentis]KAI1515156.1 hypothetical protein Ptr86124_006479 [Pyrenophora tritici-repentis]KAI1526846.1 hypothetical protein PtrSN001C_010090 [Pyrenophora tritici-repentis]
MGFLSIPFLPESFAVFETWIARAFLFLGLISIGPWAALLIYDLLLYVCRACAHEMPIIGGRARGKARPRAPSLTERPSGRRRNFSFASRAIDRPVMNTGSANAGSQDARYRQTAGKD